CYRHSGHIAEDAQRHLVVKEPCQRLGAVADNQGRFGGGETRPEPLQEARQQVGSRRAGGRDPDLSAYLPARGLDRLIYVFQLREQPVGALGDADAGRRQDHSARRPLEQGFAAARFQRLDVSRDGRLADREFLRRAGHAAAARHKAEQMQGVEVERLGHNICIIPHFNQSAFDLCPVMSYPEGMFHLFKRNKIVTPVITAEELAHALAAETPPLVVDVRSLEEYQAGHLPGAIHIPMEELAARAATLDPQALTVFY